MQAVIRLRDTLDEELATLVRLESQAHARRFVHGTGVDRHRETMRLPGVRYLTILAGRARPAGFFILVWSPDKAEVEFRRIVVDEACLGTGQAAIKEMESWCRTRWGPLRIWLDVYEDNGRARYVYEKLGYRPFSERVKDGRKLLYYCKAL